MRKWIVAAVLGLAGCTTAAEPGAEDVKFTSAQTAAQGCRFLGQESVSAGAMPLEITKANSITKMRNLAISKGANVVITPGPQVTMTGPISTVTGDLYAC